MNLHQTVNRVKDYASGNPKAASSDPFSTSRKNQGVGEANPKLAKLKATFCRHHHFEDTSVIDVTLACVAANDMDLDPLWLHLVSAPSSGKTELLMALQDCPQTVFISDFTPNSLVSGYRDPPQEGKKGKKHKRPEPAKDYSLLPVLDGKLLITKDFSVLHSKPYEARAQILAQLRDAYDGYHSRKVGNDDLKGFHARFNYLTGMTPDIERGWSLNTLGERFLLFRMNVKNRLAHARRALEACKQDKTKVRDELKGAVQEFFAKLKPVKPECDADMTDRVVHLAEIVAVGRTYIHREKNDDVVYIPQAEMPTRVAKQLLRLGLGLAMIRERETLTDEEFRVMKRVAFDSLPGNRRLLLDALWENRGKWQGIDIFLAKLSRISKTTVLREFKNLVELGVVEQSTQEITLGKGTTRRTIYRMTKTFVGYCGKVGGLPPL
jgi:hypothetical protein